MMAALKSLLQMSDQERAAAEQKYKMIAPFLNKTSF